MIYVDCFVIDSDQKFLIEKVMDEDVTELTIDVRDFNTRCSRISTWMT